MSTKANFRALREEVGLSLAELAEIMHVHRNSVQRWESLEFKQDPPEEAWQFLNNAMAMRKNLLKRVFKDNDFKALKSSRAKKITLTYFRDQAEYDEYGRDEGSFKLANANTRAVARKLVEDGINPKKIEFCYPYEEANSYQQLKQAGKIS